MGSTAGYTARIRVRYNECDVQGIAFNANYLVFVDETVDRWMTDTVGEDAIDLLVKRATLEWSSPARRGETLTLAPRVTRWGTTSFDVTVTGAVGDRHVFTATMLYVNVTPGTTTPAPVPPDVRAAFDAASAASGASAAGGPPPAGPVPGPAGVAS